MAKYTVTYTSGSTGYGWTEEYDRLADFEYFVDQMRDEYTAYITVFDNRLEEFIFWKDCLTFKPRIDMLHEFGRDMRTRTRHWK